MTGGLAYVFDDKGSFPERVNPKHVAWLRCPNEDIDRVKALIVEHVQLTESSRARELLDNLDEVKATFWKVMPIGSADDRDVAATHDRGGVVVNASEAPSFSPNAPAVE